MADYETPSTDTESNIPTGCLKWGAIVFGVIALAIGAIIFHDEYYVFHTDADGDKVMDYQDYCPKDIGIAANNGCADQDSDNDGWKVNVPGLDNIVDAKLDKCPDKAGDDADFGCPPPTPEEAAVIKFDADVASCAASNGCYCRGVDTEFTALPKDAATDARKAAVADAADRLNRYEISSNYWDVRDIPEIEADLAKVKDEKVRKDLRAEAQKKIAQSFYNSCDIATGQCFADSERIMTRTSAYQAVMLFGAFDAYDKVEDLVDDLGRTPGLVAAHENGLTEAQTATAIGINMEDAADDSFAFPGDCDDQGKFYAQAKSFGWFAAQANACVDGYEQNLRFRSGIVFARQAGNSQAVMRLEQAAVKDALDHGEESIDVQTGHQSVVVEDHEDRIGS